MTSWFALGIAALVELAQMRAGMLRPHAGAWADTGWQSIRGVTIGPIENARHASRGYGTIHSARAVDEVTAMGGNWISVTPFGRINDLDPDGIDLTFEMPFGENRRAVAAMIRQAKERGLRVMLVPHLWVESQEWRALVDPKTDAGWDKWAKAYRKFLFAWADVAQQEGADALSIGVELRSWATTRRVDSLVAIVRDVRRSYRGLLTYSANWDDAVHTLLWDEVDLIGINAFFPLAEKPGASLPQLIDGARRAIAPIAELSRGVRKPVVLVEFGFTALHQTAVTPWVWPENAKDVVVDQRAQADAYGGLLAAVLDEPWCAGFFVWRMYADPDDVSQEPEFGFSPRGKLAELVLRDAFTARHAADGEGLVGDALARQRAVVPGILSWVPSDPLFE